MFRFTNLREIVLIVDKEWAGRCGWEFDLQGDEGKKQCVADLTAHFRAASIGLGDEGLGCRVPEIIFREPDHEIAGK